ncbi:MAG: CDP-diacylglycerol--glycerol-3-phosphate 3-phosphatidyltransferase [Candidatus Hydrogenedentes bacterium]|nr:CDP-diacylglycerol--glycerol-3-phosphate 3-phosphatidyltransferase [Candidatus Hydrogenedentota bacterium]
MTLPNKLTVARVIMVPIFVALLSFPTLTTFALAYAVFVAATLTDYYDGKIARERNLVTNFGKLLDPVADKVLLAAAFIMLMKLEPIRIPGWSVVAILSREFLVTGARSLAASQGTVIAASASGKTKAVLQMVYIFVFLFFAAVDRIVMGWAADYVLPFRAVLGAASFWAIVFVAAYTVYSGIDFARANWGILHVGQES